MIYHKVVLLCFSLFALPLNVFAAADNTQLAVWANEAIVATYTYNYTNFLERQKKIAFYFTAKGWIAYSTALTNANLPKTVQDNTYDVTAVATMPPKIKVLHDNYWQAVMPLLVVYKNIKYEQKQTLEVTLEFTIVPTGQGVRGLAITSLQSKVVVPACQCTPEAHPTIDSAVKHP